MKPIWRNIAIGTGTVVISIVGIIGVVAVSIMVVIGAWISSQTHYRPYTKAQLKLATSQELVYPGSTVWEEKLINPSPFDEYEMVDLVIELPKQKSYQDYLVWLFENTCPNGRWTFAQPIQEPWTKSNLIDYPNQTFADDRDGTTIRVTDNLNDVYVDKQFQKTVVAQGILPDALQDPYTIYRGPNQGVLLFIQWTVSVNNGSMLEPNQPPAKSVPLNVVFTHFQGH